MTDRGSRFPDDSLLPHVLVGLLGWSNKRSGVEFYRWDDKIIPRHGSEWGDLLAQNEAIARAEGCPVIVVALPRATTPEQVQQAASAVLDAFRSEQVLVRPYALQKPTPRFWFHSEPHSTGMVFASRRLVEELGGNPCRRCFGKKA